MNGSVQSNLATLAFNNGEQLEDFHSKILRLQQEIMLSGEIVSPTRILFQYMKALIKSEKLRAFIAPNMTYFITFLDKNGKSAVYTGGDIHSIYRYLDIIGSPTTLTTSGQCYHHFGYSSSRKIIQQLSNQLLQLSARDRKVFLNAVEFWTRDDSCISFVSNSSTAFKNTFCLVRRAAITGWRVSV